MKREPEVMRRRLQRDVRALALSAFEAGFKACESGINLDCAKAYFVRTILNGDGQ